MISARLVLLAVVLMAPFTATNAQVTDQIPVSWETFRTRFITMDGRVLDPQNGRRSHSEGQGYALILAAEYNDPATFDLLRRWTKNNLRGRQDSLHAWAWGLRPNMQWQIQDYNTATDGDLLIAYGLLLGAKRFNLPEAKAEAALIAASMRELLTITVGKETVLLPGYYGFMDAEGRILINPSYLNPNAYRALATVDDAAFWNGLADQAARQIQAWRFGPYSLPPDWLLLTPQGVPVPLPDSRHNFGFDAVRVLLYGAWSDLPTSSALISFLIHHDTNELEGALSLTGEPALAGKTTSAPAGFLAIYARILGDAGQHEAAQRFHQAALKALMNDPDNYYAAVLVLLAELFPRTES